MDGPFQAQTPHFVAHQSHSNVLSSCNAKSITRTEKGCILVWASDCTHNIDYDSLGTVQKYVCARKRHECIQLLGQSCSEWHVSVRVGTAKTPSIKKKSHSSENECRDCKSPLLGNPDFVPKFKIY
eukprot:1432940-Amphidinium_carterae.1